MTTKGKRLSPAQRRVLELMAQGGTLDYWQSDGNAFVRALDGGIVDVSTATAFTLSRTHYLEVFHKDWRRTIYKLTDAGRAALAPAGTTSEPHGEPPAPADSAAEPVTGRTILDLSAGRAGSTS